MPTTIASLNLDYELGSLLDQLFNSGESQNTLLIITSDHGELFRRTWALFRMATKSVIRRSARPAAYLVSFPRALQVQKVREPVSLRDLPASCDGSSLGSGDRSPFMDCPSRGTGMAPVPDLISGPISHLSEELVGKKVEWWPEWFPVSKGGMKKITRRRGVSLH